MNRVHGIAVLFALSAMTSLARQTPRVPPPVIGNGTAAISGAVIDAITKRPVAGAVVTIVPITDSSAGAAAKQVTDATGRFVFTRLEAGDGYQVGATRFGYFAGGFGRSGPEGSTRRIALKNGEWFSGVAIQMWRPAAISGTVRDETGEAIVGAYVRLLPRLLVAGQAQIANGPTTRTDDRGVYRLAGLTPGRYYVSVPSVQTSVPVSANTNTISGVTEDAVARAEAGGYPVTLRRDPSVALDPNNRLLIGAYATPPPPAPDGRSQAYPPIDYPAARTRAEATLIDLRFGDERTGVDVTLTPVPTVRISGLVEGPDEARENLTVRLMLPGDEELGMGSEVATALVTPTGDFTFLNVPAGSFIVDASRVVSEYTYSGMTSLLATGELPETPARFGGGEMGSAVFSGPPGTGMMTRGSRRPSDAFFGSTRVSASGDLSGVVVTLQRGVTMRGTLVSDQLGDGGGRAGGGLSVLVAQPAGGEATLGMIQSRRPPGDDKPFVIEGLRSGKYLLHSVGVTIKSIVWNGKDYTYTPFDASAGRDFDDVVVTTTAQRAIISGVIRDAQGQPAASASVIHFPIERAQWREFGIQPPRLGAVAASNGGTFSLGRIPAGEYLLIAVSEDRATEWRDPAFLEAAAPMATRVSVGWGETKTQDLVLRVVR